MILAFPFDFLLMMYFIFIVRDDIYENFKFGYQTENADLTNPIAIASGFYITPFLSVSG